MQDTLGSLAEAKEKGGDAVLVSYSGGKDSLAVLDLCSRSFGRVEGFFMYLVPGLECCEAMLEYAKKRWGTKIHQVPHWITKILIESGAYCFNHISTDDLPPWSLRDVYDYVKLETGVGLIATGAKRSDGAARRMLFGNLKRDFFAAKYTDILYPLKTWNKFDVLAFLRSRSIPVPPGTGKNTSGIDLSSDSLVWLSKKYPQDLRRICEYFPFAEAVVWRHRWYGI